MLSSMTFRESSSAGLVQRSVSVSILEVSDLIEVAKFSKPLRNGF